MIFIVLGRITSNPASAFRADVSLSFRICFYKYKGRFFAFATLRLRMTYHGSQGGNPG
jgi:hypothetical protein